ncbi:MAG TPA: hypothetical protein VF815_46855, partial [Myxococcaceae bacterium]
RALKKEILRISEQASSKVIYDNEDNDPRVRARLMPLIQELVALAPERTQQQKLADVVGVWKSAWSDLTYYTPVAPRADAMYQIVFPTGYYYNLSTFDGPQGPYMSVIKGLFTVAEPALQIQFVKTTRYPEPLPRGADLATLAMRAELGLYDFEIDPNNAPGIGFQTNFRQEYVDDELRIGTGQVATGFNSLFILRRADKVE